MLITMLTGAFENGWVGRGDWEVFLCVILHLHQRIFSVVQNSVWLLFTIQFGTIQFRAVVLAIALRCGTKGEITTL